MINVCLMRKFFAILLLLALFVARLNAVSHPVCFSQLQDYISKTDFIADAETKPRVAHFKAQNHGADVPVPCSDFVFVEVVFETLMEFPPVLEKNLPEGHVSIFIPPA